MSHVLYRFYSATGQLLYIGITMNPAQRFRSHRDTKDWWGDIVGITLEHYKTREALAEAEKRAIQVERPLHNIVRPKLRPNQSAAEKASITGRLEAAAQFKTPAIHPALDALFDGEPRSETRYGLVTESEYERRAAIDRARAEAIRNCNFCDSSGYRNMYVCDHIDHTPEGERKTRREARKKQLQVVRNADRADD